jgi:NAD-dependent dihydropyrimidine dehydrogenase PreA subunit
MFRWEEGPLVLRDRGLRPARLPAGEQYRAAMTYVIGSACVDVMHKSCVRVCPVDCIYEGARALYINPDECVDCGACKLECEVGAIDYETDLPEDERQHLADNSAFFTEILPGRYTPPSGPRAAQTNSARLASTRLWSPPCHRGPRRRRTTHQRRRRVEP